MFSSKSFFIPLFTHSPQRWSHGSTDWLFLLLFLLLHISSSFVSIRYNFQTGLTFQATPVTPVSSCSFSLYFLEHFCLENCPLLSGEVSTDSRHSSDSYFSSVQSSPGPDIKLAQIWLTNKSQPWAGYKTGSLLLFVENRQYSQYSQSSRTILQIVKFRYKTYNLEITQINAKSQAPD